MSGDEENKVVKLADAFKSPEKTLTGRKKSGDNGSGGGGARPPAEEPALPETLPPDSPVKALGTMDGDYFFLDSLGQLRRKKEGELGRTQILSLFGGWNYLRATWPKWAEVDGAWIRKKEFNHSWLAPVLIQSCSDMGVWDPANRVRGCGSWMEANGDLIMHCGNKLFRSQPGGAVLVQEPGLHGDLLYPRRSPLPEPDLLQTTNVGEAILTQLETWNFRQDELGRLIVLGDVVCMMLGQAGAWRPMMWTTAPKGSGKSTLLEFLKLLIGEKALLSPTATSQAYVYQSIGDSSLPVLLDEFEAKEDNKRIQDVIELMRIAASGGELGRGGSDNNPKTYTLKSCFAAFSILMPPLTPQDRSRMAIVELGKLRHRDEDTEFSVDQPDDHDLALGDLARWQRIGCQLRGRVLKQWPRYRQTYRAYFTLLRNLFRDARPAAQFGALGAGQDLARFNSLDMKNVQAWVEMVKGLGLAEVDGYDNEPEGCLKFLLAQRLDKMSHGTQETVAYYLRQARDNLLKGELTNDPEDAARMLAKVGIRIDKDKTAVARDPKTNRDVPVTWIFVSSTHPELMRWFANTHWKGRAGSAGAYAQALGGHPAAAEKAAEAKIDGMKHHGRRLMWEGIFPPGDADDSAQVVP